MGDATVRLYWEDVRLGQFAATVVEHGSWQGRPTVILDRTAFYPEAGGQMADHGTLAGAPVDDVQLDEAGRIHHVLAAVPAEGVPAVGSRLAGEIDRARRRAHMALHTAQHMLSRALLDEAGAETLSARLGGSATIDVKEGPVAGAASPARHFERDVAAAEALVNAAIDDDLAIRCWFPSPAELVALPLRREPKVEREIRVVEIGAFDASPCGGTHCERTAHVGLVRVLGIERYKGGHRITFEAGERARRVLGAHQATLRALSQSLSCPPGEVALAVERLRGELKAAGDTAAKLRERLAAQLATTLVAEAGGAPIVFELDDADQEILRALGQKLAARPGALAFLAARSAAGLDVVVTRGPGSDFDCGAFLKRAAARGGGRGGGRPTHAEGRLPAGVDWRALVAEER